VDDAERKADREIDRLIRCYGKDLIKKLVAEKCTVKAGRPVDYKDIGALFLIQLLMEAGQGRGEAVSRVVTRMSKDKDPEYHRLYTLSQSRQAELKKLVDQMRDLYRGGGTKIYRDGAERNAALDHLLHDLDGPSRMWLFKMIGHAV
jgi:hypothetical protein